MKEKKEEVETRVEVRITLSCLPNQHSNSDARSDGSAPSSSSSPVLTAHLVVPSETDICPIAQEPILEFYASASAVPSGGGEEDFPPLSMRYDPAYPEHTAMRLECGHVFSAVHLVYHFLRSESVLCPVCRAGSKENRLRHATLPFQLRKVLVPRARREISADTTEQIRDDEREMHRIVQNEGGGLAVAFFTWDQSASAFVRRVLDTATAVLAEQGLSDDGGEEEEEEVVEGLPIPPHSIDNEVSVYPLMSPMHRWCLEHLHRACIELVPEVGDAAAAAGSRVGGASPSLFRNYHQLSSVLFEDRIVLMASVGENGLGLECPPDVAFRVVGGIDQLRFPPSRRFVGGLGGRRRSEEAPRENAEGRAARIMDPVPQRMEARDSDGHVDLCMPFNNTSYSIRLNDAGRIDQISFEITLVLFCIMALERDQLETIGLFFPSEAR